MSFLKSCFIGVALASLVTGPAFAEKLPVEQIKMPPGFKIGTYARVPGARSISVVESLNLAFVGTRGDSIYAILDANKDHRADRVVRVKSGLRVPNGVVWHAGYLYVAEQHRIVRFKAPSLTSLALAKPEVLFDALPDHGHHGWRYAGGHERHQRCAPPSRRISYRNASDRGKSLAGAARGVNVLDFRF